jgi:hypothetical protein
MAVRSDPKVDITVKLSTIQEMGVSFAPGFRMLIHEI